MCWLRLRDVKISSIQKRHVKLTGKKNLNIKMTGIITSTTI